MIRFHNIIWSTETFGQRVFVRTKLHSVKNCGQRQEAQEFRSVAANARQVAHARSQERAMQDPFSGESENEQRHLIDVMVTKQFFLIFHPKSLDCFSIWHIFRHQPGLTKYLISRKQRLTNQTMMKIPCSWSRRSRWATTNRGTISRQCHLSAALSPKSTIQAECQAMPVRKAQQDELDRLLEIFRRQQVEKTRHKTPLFLLADWGAGCEASGSTEWSGRRETKGSQARSGGGKKPSGFCRRSVSCHFTSSFFVKRKRQSWRTGKTR